MADTLTDMEEDEDIFDLGIADSLLFQKNDAPAKKRKKIIGLDDLLNDLKEEQKSKQNKSKGAKARKHYKDNDDDETEISLSKAVDQFQEEIKKIDGQNDNYNGDDSGNDISAWGLQVFGPQRNPSPVAYSDLGCSKLVQTFMNHKLNSLVDLSMERGESFLRGLLLNGWLSNLVLKCGHLEESIAIWTFNQFLYSSEESTMKFSCEFWCSILLYNEVDATPIKIDWLPCYSLLKEALESFGFLLHSHGNVASSKESSGSSACHGPPSNIRSWIKFIGACCQVRSRHHIFSISETEELIEVIICLFIDQQLQGLSSILHESLLSAMNFFTDEEWKNSCQRVAKSLPGRVPKDLNCLRMVECIPSVDTRGKQLKKAVALEILKLCFHEKIGDAQDALRLLISSNLKDRNCDFFHTYLYLVLINNWFTFGTPSNDQAVDQMWGTFLQKCSSQISNNDFRPYAQEVRNRASYLLKAASRVGSF
ncbi:hypothetical protein Dimus_009893 [Dionaea muscipula]